MKFHLIDQVLERSSERIVAVKHVSLAEEYLADHFPSFPVLPGVLMLEAMVQAARVMLAGRGPDRLVLGEVKALKYSAMVRPGQALEVEVTLRKAVDGGPYPCRGIGRLRTTGAGPDIDSGGGTSDGGETVVSGRFTMRAIRRAGGRRTTAGEPTL